MRCVRGRAYFLLGWQASVWLGTLPVARTIICGMQRLRRWFQSCPRAANLRIVKHKRSLVKESREAYDGLPVSGGTSVHVCDTGASGAFYTRVPNNR